MSKSYTDAQKAAYYKKKYMAKSKSSTYVPKKKVYKKKSYPARTTTAIVKAPGAISSAGKYVGGGLGSAFGPVGTGVGSFLGGKLGHLIETVTGFGDYKVHSNTILTGGMPVPQIVNSLDRGGIIVRHREFIADIPAATTFTLKKFSLNPGLFETFPWLAQIAASFEQYKLRGMLFEYVSTSSDALLSTAASTALGSVMMATDYDVADPSPADKRTMLNSEFASSSKPSNSFIHPIECKKSLTAQNILYTRNGQILPDFDLRLYDFANFYIATDGMQAATGNIGELWVTYEIEFFKQQYSFLGLTDHYRMTTITAARPFGTIVNSNLGAGGTIGGLMSGDGLSYSFPPTYASGKYMLVYDVIGTVAAVYASPAITLANCTSLSILQGDTIGQLGVPQNALAGVLRFSIIILLTITAQNASITLNGAGTYPTGTLIGDLFVTRIADSIKAVPV